MTSNIVNRNDSYFTFNTKTFEDNHIPYDPFNKKEGSYFPDGNPIFTRVFFQDPNIYISERSVFTITDAVSKTGGLAGAVKFVFILLGSFFQ